MEHLREFQTALSKYVAMDMAVRKGSGRFKPKDLHNVEQQVVEVVNRHPDFPINQLTKHSIDESNDVSWPVLHAAIYYSMPALVEALLNKGAINLELENSWQMNALEMAEDGAESHSEGENSRQVRIYEMVKAKEQERQEALTVDTGELARGVEAVGGKTSETPVVDTPQAGPSKKAKKQKRQRVNRAKKEYLAKQAAAEEKRQSLKGRFDKLPTLQTTQFWADEDVNTPGNWEVVGLKASKAPTQSSGKAAAKQTNFQPKETQKSTKSTVASQEKTGSTQRKPDSAKLQPAPVPKRNPWQIHSPTLTHASSPTAIDSQSALSESLVTLAVTESSDAGTNDSRVDELAGDKAHLERMLLATNNLNHRQAQALLASQRRERSKDLQNKQLKRELQNWKLAYEVQRLDYLKMHQDNAMNEQAGISTNSAQLDQHLRQEEEAIQLMEERQQQIQALEQAPTQAEAERVIQNAQEMPKTWMKLSTNPDDYAPAPSHMGGRGYVVKQHVPFYAGSWVPFLPQSTG